jgi:hypothetical protein
MRLHVFGFTVLAAAGLSSCIGTGRADRAALLIPRPVRPVTAEPGVVPAGTWLVIRANDGVNTQRAFRGTIYDASVAEDVLDQNGSRSRKSHPLNWWCGRYRTLAPGV